MKEPVIAYCGLYCGACRSYQKGKCPGCAKNVKANWCKIKKCCEEQSLKSCADCIEFNDVMKCKKFNHIISKIFAIILRSNRHGNIEYIKQNGYAAFADLMIKTKSMSVRKGLLNENKNQH
jgi:Protein of unknown function (DUF3795)